MRNSAAIAGRGRPKMSDKPKVYSLARAKEIMLQSMGSSTGLVDAGQCPFCHEQVDFSKFRTQTDVNENRISGLCQKCMDDTFGGPPSQPENCGYWGCIDVDVGIVHHPHCGEDPSKIDPNCTCDGCKGAS